MSRGLPKSMLIEQRTKWELALHALARELGKDHWITKGMGSVAWGRYEGESQPDESMPHVAEGWGFLQGVRYALLQVAREEDRDGEYHLARIHERMKR